MKRQIGIVLAWLAATVVSILVATAAVGAVRGNVTDAPPSAAAATTTTTAPVPTTATTATPPAATSTSTSTTSTTAPTASPTTTAAPETTVTSTTATMQPPAATHIETFTTIGGTVTVEVSASEIRLLGAAPNSGFTVSEKELTPTRIEIEFGSDDHESQFRAQLEHGVLDTEVQEEGED